MNLKFCYILVRVNLRRVYHVTETVQVVKDTYCGLVVSWLLVR